MGADVGQSLIMDLLIFNDGKPVDAGDCEEVKVVD